MAPLVTTTATDVVDDPHAGVGELPLTPIMAWLDECGGQIDAFNQWLLVRLPAGATTDSLTRTLQAVADRHDVLRSRLVRATAAAPGRLVIEPPGAGTPTTALRHPYRFPRRPPWSWLRGPAAATR